MPCPSYRAFASIAEAAYWRAGALTPGFVRLDHSHTEAASGFKGAIFRSTARGGSDTYVVSFAGTDTAETGGGTKKDVMADIGFAGPKEIRNAIAIAPVKATKWLAKGKLQLAAQLADAKALVNKAIQKSDGSQNLYVTGHSLGGGLAQLVCSSMTSLKGVAFNAPATSQLGIPTVPASRFVNVNENNDPVSLGTILSGGGHHQGKTVWVEAGVIGTNAHKQSHLINHLSLTGAGSKLGGQRPF